MTYSVYVVTDTKVSGKTHEEQAESAYAGGADVVQLRDKEMSAADMLEAAKNIIKISKNHKKLFIVNDRVDVALVAGADGVHIGQSDLPCNEVRKIVPDDFIIGVSVSSVTEAVKAERDGADYIALSPIFSTSTKKDAGEGKGLDTLMKMKRAVKIPVLAIGGISAENAEEIIMGGADGLAVVSAVLAKGLCITDAVKEMKIVIEKAKFRASEVRQ